MVLGTLDDAFENELLRPSQFLEERPEKRRFSKWPIMLMGEKNQLYPILINDPSFCLS